MAKFVVFAKRVDPMEARLRVFCMTDDREDKTLEQQENFTEVAKSRDVEVLENKVQYLELVGNLIPVTKSGDQLQFSFKAFKENRLPFSVRVKDQHADIVGRALFMREPKVAKGEPPQTPTCMLNIVLPENIFPENSVLDGSQEIINRLDWSHELRQPYEKVRITELKTSDISNLLGDDWTRLASEIGITQSEIEKIINENPNSTAQQAQAMLKLFQSKEQNDINILENGLRSIHRDDIAEQCLISRTFTTTTTSTISTNQVIKRHPKRTSETNGYDERDLIKDSESLDEITKKRYGRYEHDESKYSAEEKIVESDEDENEAAKRTVAERREKIVKRLSGEQKQPPSVQHQEIVEEITTIKRQSFIDDTRAKHEEEIILQKPVDNSYKSSNVSEQVIKLKTATHDSSSIDKDDFDKELQDKFTKTLGDVEKFEHKFVNQTVTQKTQNFLESEIQHSGIAPEKTSTVVTSQRVTVTTDSSGKVIRDEDESIENIQLDDDDVEQFERIEREILKSQTVDEILEEARQRADDIQNNVVTTTKTVTINPGETETKETIITTTIKKIENITIDQDGNVSRVTNVETGKRI
jgi:plasmid maintenance system antidote protein VapI